MATTIRKRSAYEHPHQRMARERRRALVTRWLILVALVLLVTLGTVGAALVMGS